MPSPNNSPPPNAPPDTAPINHEAYMLKDLDTGMKSYVTDQEWVEKPVLPVFADAGASRPPVLPPRGAMSKRARSDELQSARALRQADHVRVVTHKKRERDFANLYRWQRIRAHAGPIRVLEFSRAGEFLATAGEDSVIKIWDIDARLADNRASVLRGEAGEGNRARATVAYMYIKKGAPCAVFKGHTSDITALSWSKHNFLLSASMDKTIRLWHPDAKGCIRRLLHNDIVTCVAFHPFDEHICISGTASGTLRIWHLEERKCLSSTEVEDLISACLITPDGAWALVGTYRGRCLFYGLYDEIQGEWQFKHTTQMDVRSRRAKNALGKKICGFQWYGTKTDQVMVSSNDSRLRLYQLDDKSVLCKFFGHQNSQSQHAASFSPDGRYVLCASETRAVHIWEMDYAIYSARDTKKPLQPQHGADTRKDGGQAYESFAAQDGGHVTAAVFAPRLVPRDALHARAAFSNARTSGMVIVTAGEDGEMRVFGCC